MAAFDTTRPTEIMSLSHAKRFFSTGFGRLAAWNDARVTRKSLSRLSLRELEDIGLTPADIITASRTR